jgi:hypothetical protein
MDKTLLLILLKILLGLFFTYAISSWVIYALVIRLVRPSDDALPKYFFLTLGSGPLLIALFMWGFYFFFPGHTDSFYITGMVAIFAGLAALAGRYGLSAVFRLYNNVCRQCLSSFDWRGNLPGVLLTVGASVFLLVQGITSILTPVYGSDQSQYALVSSLGYQRKSFDFYPLRDYDRDTGYYDLSDHPPAYYMLKIWHYSLQGTADFAGVSKLIEPAYLIFLALIIGFVLLPYGLLATGIGITLMALVPGLQAAVEYHAIDPFRLAPFLLCLLWLREALISPRPSILCTAGFFTGLSMFPHSIGGLLSFPFFASLYLLLSRRSFWGRLLDLVCVGLIAMLIGGWGYLLNASQSGTAVAAALPLFDQIKSIDYYTNRMFGMGIQNHWDMLFKGILKQFTNIKYYGIAAWMALLMPVFCFRRLREDCLLQIAALGCLGFILLMTLASFFPQQRYIIFTLNPRYPLTTQLLFVISGAVGLTAVLGLLGRLLNKSGRLPLQQALTWLIALLLGWNMVYAAKFTTKALRHGDISFMDDGLQWQSAHLDENAYLYIKNRLPKDKLFLAQSDAMFAYAFRRKVIGDIYPKMLPFYQAASPTQAADVLRHMGIDYLLMHTGWWPSVVANTHMQHVISNPRQVDLVFQDSTTSVFRLLPIPRPVETVSELQAAAGKWKKSKTKQKAIFSFDPKSGILALSKGSASWTPPLNHNFPRANYRYVLSGTLAGSGQLDIKVKCGEDPNFFYLWESASANPAERTFNTQFLLPEGNQPVQIIFIPRLNRQSMTVKDIRLITFKVGGPNVLSPK